MQMIADQFNQTKHMYTDRIFAEILIRNEASKIQGLQRTINRYLNQTKSTSTPEKEDESCVQKWRSEATTLGKKIEAIEAYKSKLLGECLGSCSVQELKELEMQLQKSLCNIRQRKEVNLLKENMVLRDQYCKAAATAGDDDRHNMDVETELMIGRPGTST
uniref:K-box domain-containing protein n=1 Tax=Oryza brachyantha TaxID=4533 RepID=J3L8S1_ORYBR